MKNLVLNFILLAAAMLFFATSMVVSQNADESFEVEEIDLSLWDDKWRWGNTAFRGTRFYMRSKFADGYFFVLVAPDDYTTVGRSTSVTLSNVKGLPTRLGSGIVFHSTVEPLEQDYVFAIDTVRRRYRVARHSSGKEIKVVRWRPSRLIRGGRRANTLEVRDRGAHVDLYINGTRVHSVKTPFAAKNGVPGLYVDATPIAFKNFRVTEPRPIAPLVAGQTTRSDLAP